MAGSLVVAGIVMCLVALVTIVFLVVLLVVGVIVVLLLVTVFFLVVQVVETLGKNDNCILKIAPSIF